MKKIANILILILTAIIVSSLCTACDFGYDGYEYYYCERELMISGLTLGNDGYYHLIEDKAEYTAYFTLKLSSDKEGLVEGRLAVTNAADVSIKCSAEVGQSGNYQNWFDDTVENEGETSLSFSVDKGDVRKNGLRFIVTFKVTAPVDDVDFKLIVNNERIYLDGTPVKVLSADDCRGYADFDQTASYETEKIDKAQKLIRFLADKIAEGASESEVSEIEDQIDELYDQINFTRAVAEIIYRSDVKNEQNKKLYQDLDEALTDMKRDWEKAYNDEENADRIAELNKENTEIELLFNDLNDPALDDKTLEYYQQVVENNKEIATLSGYDNFLEYAYAEIYDRDYSLDDSEALYGLIKQNVVPAYNAMLEKYREIYRRYNNRDYFIIAQYNELQDETYYTLREDYIGEYISTYDPSVMVDMLSLFRDGVACFADSENCYQGAFVDFDEDWETPLAYFGSEYDDLFSVIHESGHFYHAKVMGVDCGCYDFLETQSQGNEMMFLAFLYSMVPEDVYRFLKYDQLWSMMSTILHATAVDKFERYVYLNDVDPADYDRTFKAICNEFGIESYSYWRYVALSSPAYYISYATSAVVAINLYGVAAEDYQAAQDIYLSLFNSQEKTFENIVTAAGLSDPFTDAAYEVFGKIVK